MVLRYFLLMVMLIVNRYQVTYLYMLWFLLTWNFAWNMHVTCISSFLVNNLSFTGHLGQTDQAWPKAFAGPDASREWSGLSLLAAEVGA